MHIGKKKNCHNYTMSSHKNNEETSLVKPDFESDLRKLVSKNLKFQAQVNTAASKANISLGIFKGTLKSRDALESRIA